MAMGFAFLGQSTAVLVINNYGPLQYAALGFGTEDQLRLQCGWISVGVVTNMIGAAIMDRVGRRPLMLFGVFGCCVCCESASSPQTNHKTNSRIVIIEAAMVAAFATGPDAGQNRVGLAFGVVAFYAFLAVYGLGIDVCGVVWYSEVFPNHIRAKGICLSIATIALTDLVYLQATATAFANIGWHFYLLFICITFVGGIIFYFILPETRGIPLEEIAKIFGETEDIMVFSEDLHVDRNTHELVVEQHNNRGSLSHIATEQGRPSTGNEKHHAEKVEQAV
jgi:MFS family permease